MLSLGTTAGALGFFLGNLGAQELLIILVIAVLIFGGRKIPEIGKGLGEGIRQFKASIKGDDDKTAEKNNEEAKTASS